MAVLPEIKSCGLIMLLEFSVSFMIKGRFYLRRINTAVWILLISAPFLALISKVNAQFGSNFV